MFTGSTQTGLTGSQSTTTSGDLTPKSASQILAQSQTNRGYDTQMIASALVKTTMSDPSNAANIRGDVLAQLKPAQQGEVLRLAQAGSSPTQLKAGQRFTDRTQFVRYYKVQFFDQSIGRSVTISMPVWSKDANVPVVGKFLNGGYFTVDKSGKRVDINLDFWSGSDFVKAADKVALSLYQNNQLSPSQTKIAQPVLGVAGDKSKSLIISAPDFAITAPGDRSTSNRQAMVSALKDLNVNTVQIGGEKQVQLPNSTEGGKYWATAEFVSGRGYQNVPLGASTEFKKAVQDTRTEIKIGDAIRLGMAVFDVASLASMKGTGGSAFRSKSGNFSGTSSSVSIATANSKIRSSNLNTSETVNNTPKKKIANTQNQTVASNNKNLSEPRVVGSAPLSPSAEKIAAARGNAKRGDTQLTDNQVRAVKKYAKQLGLNENDIQILKNTSAGSAYSPMAKQIWIAPNVFPIGTSKRNGGTVLERLTPKAVIAHEAGHMKTSRNGVDFRGGSLADEVLASIEGSKLKGLSKTEKFQLLRDATERAKAEGTTPKRALEDALTRLLIKSVLIKSPVAIPALKTGQFGKE
jgi:hypothetical protein